jgi:hypothetical protein
MTGAENRRELGAGQPIGAVKFVGVGRIPSPVTLRLHKYCRLVQSIQKEFFLVITG